MEIMNLQINISNEVYDSQVYQIHAYKLTFGLITIHPETVEKILKQDFTINILRIEDIVVLRTNTSN
jgi:hypothetical protein